MSSQQHQTHGDGASTAGSTGYSDDEARPALRQRSYSCPDMHDILFKMSRPPGYMYYLGVGPYLSDSDREDDSKADSKSDDPKNDSEGEMSDNNPNKRSSVGGRAPVPVPRVSQQANQNQNQQNNTPLMSVDATLARVLGAKIRIKVANVETEHLGYVVNISLTHGVISISPTRLGSQPSGQSIPSSNTLGGASSGFTMISISSIENFQVLELATPEQVKAVQNAIPVLTNAEVERNVDNAHRRNLEEMANQGKGVTAEAQQLYDALRRIFPVRWAEKGAFIVNENTLVEPPYGPENCKPVDGAQEKAIAYVKKVLDSERKKLAANKGPKVPPEAEKKGG